MSEAVHPLRTIRIAHGWTQHQLAAKSNVSTHTIWRTELHGNVPFRYTQKKLLKALGLSYEMRDEVFPR